MKYTFVVSTDSLYLFALTCTMNVAKYLGMQADFHIIYDNISEEVRNLYTDSYPFQIVWHPILPLYQSLEVHATKHVPSRFWTTPWLLASQLLDSYDSICVLQSDEFLMTNVTNFFRVAALTDSVIATEYHVGIEAENLPFGTVNSIFHRGDYAFYDQLVFCGKANKRILIDTYKGQCEDLSTEREISETNDPLCTFNQACSTHLSPDKVIGLDCHMWTWDRGAWSRYKVWHDTTNKKLYDREIRIHGMHTQWWKDGIVTSAIRREREAGNHETADIIAHNYNAERDIMVSFNELTPKTKNNYYTKEKFE